MIYANIYIIFIIYNNTHKKLLNVKKTCISSNKLNKLTFICIFNIYLHRTKTDIK